MTEINRRHLAQGAAWALPAVALANAAPAAAASRPKPVWPRPRPTSRTAIEDLREGICSPAVAAGWILKDGLTYRNTHGRIEDAQTMQRFGLQWANGPGQQGLKGSITFKFGNASGERYLPKPKVTLNNGQTLYGFVRAGNVMSGGALVGFNTLHRIEWQNAKHYAEGSRKGLWNGARVEFPMEFSYTLNGKCRVCMLQVNYTMGSVREKDQPMRDYSVTPYTGMPFRGKRYCTDRVY
ncbi:hypothetical protein [Falsarthrobacter nasiphocae]|uniref:Tat pathway signal protein n=1 Tax=Falsarthrobacter nasiphocae TaxID=189863 RepID=A0AAE3YI23_9MICC|nr:hypothetical protein [Falsarthrobacter nasiphocae]MDR6892318.1 hypothetical protein [Falsarthrobacter nasiphocae]